MRVRIESKSFDDARKALFKKYPNAEDVRLHEAYFLK